MQHVLTLVRHAKSSWDQAGLSDYDRALNDRGLKDAPEMGRRLADAGYAVDTIIASPAIRAITTAEIIANEIGYSAQKIVQDAEIYNADIDALIDRVFSLDTSVNSVMLVGHNPGFTVLCNYLSDARIDNMPTCSIAQIQFNSNSWEAISEHSGELLDFDYPKKR
ncbi:MAG: histidine phosphatase family protein [Gammaproteobacteria bacterium]|nr:MAG: histidine phosphatase family protein [Gammaproteobacteria bacterium]